MTTVQPFEIAVPWRVLDDLSDRLERTRCPGAIAGAGWEYGTDPDYLRSSPRTDSTIMTGARRKRG